MKFSTVWFYVAIVTAGQFAAVAYGGLSYTSRSLWQAAAGPSFTETFSTAPLSVLSPGATTTAGTVTVQLTGTANESNRFVDPGQVNGSRDFHGFIDNGAATIVRLITFTFPQPVLAWGADFVSADTGDRLVATSNGSSYHFAALCGSPGNCFLGSVETTPFNQLTFSTEVFTSFGEAFNMDNLSYATVPEPSTIAMLVSAMYGTASFRKRRRSFSR
jgi:hypothetical protein